MDEKSPPSKEVGGMAIVPSRLHNIKIKTFYDPIADQIVLQFESEQGPVFKAWFRPLDLREVCYGVLDHIQEIELDKDAETIS
jgi:hypothetical protein